MVREAEQAKAGIFPQQGRSTLISKIDEDYLVVGSHLDEVTKRKITSGEYVDFGKLIPRDKIIAEDDSQMKLIMKNGKAFWSPKAAGESVSINNFSKWEQAFRIYSEVYTRANPGRASELIQYNHIIHSISTTYIWDNVYSYDKEFWMHLSKHPQRSWGVILQQA